MQRGRQFITGVLMAALTFGVLTATFGQRSHGYWGTHRHGYAHGFGHGYHHHDDCDEHDHSKSKNERDSTWNEL